jgi:hypothetical protein
MKKQSTIGDAMNSQKEITVLMRLAAVGVLASALLLAGCSTFGSHKNASAPSGKHASGKGAASESLHKQPMENSFPTAQQVGL